MASQKKTDSSGIPARHIIVLFKRFFHHLRPDMGRIILNMAIICSIIATGATLIWMIGNGFDALSKSHLDVVPAYLLAFISLVVLLQVLRYGNYYLHEWMQQRCINEIRRETYKHLLDLGTPFKDKYAAGDLLTRLGQDIVRISEFLVLMPAHIFMHSVTIIIYLAILFYIDSWLTALTIFLAPLIIFHQRFFIKKTRTTAQAFLQNQGYMGAFEEESLRNIQGIVTFSATPSMLSRFDRLFSAFRRSAMRNLLLNNLFVVTFELLIAVTAIMLVVIGVYRIGQDALTVGSLINFLLYLGYLSVPLRGLANVPIESQIRAVAVERVAAILDTTPTIQDKQNAINLAKDAGAISFENVDFAYPGHANVLSNLNLHIDKGEYIAIMGASGVGKSTLAKLLLRLYDPNNGRISIDDVDLRDLLLESLRTHIAIVWQEPFLIEDTIFANLRLAKLDASEQQMRDALQDAFASEFIEKLPNGYETVLGSQGAQLSTGQKQRIAIAQALLKQASILILDEATSALDSESESTVQKAIKNVRQHCTVIVIAHRMSTITDADRIVYLNNDGTVTTGTHSELEKQHTSFQHALSHQYSVEALG